MDLKQPTYKGPEPKTYEPRGVGGRKTFPFELNQPLVSDPKDKTYSYFVPVVDRRERQRQCVALCEELLYAITHPSNENGYIEWVRRNGPGDFKTYLLERLKAVL